MYEQASEVLASGLHSSPTHIFGIDFSGAIDAGKHIWIAEGTVADSCLNITDCRSASDFLKVSPARDVTFPALVEFIASLYDAALGFDFPFGLPASMVDEDSWSVFVAAFPSRYPTLAHFDHDCHAASGGKEWKRLCDVETRAPFSPYNRRVISQTYYGIRDLLHPLLKAGQASVLPIHHVAGNVPWLLEVCPAGALKVAGLYKPPYKGRTPSHYDARLRILKSLENDGSVRVVSRALRDTILSNAPGDALDSVVAAAVTVRIIGNPDCIEAKSGEPYNVEGCIYV
jgi:hypothetical protein